MVTVLRHTAEAINPDLLESVLLPYKEHCKYLKKMSVAGESPGLITATGEFSIPDSCYIDDTGHFNSVEFHICYNQFIYVLLAYCVEHNLFGAMGGMDMEEYRRRQLPDILLAQFSTSFKRPILHADRFTGTLTIKRVSARGKTIFVKTYCTFHDDAGGFSEGEMLLAILESARAQAEPGQLTA